MRIALKMSAATFALPTNYNHLRPNRALLVKSRARTGFSFSFLLHRQTSVENTSELGKIDICGLKLEPNQPTKPNLPR